MMTMKTTNDHPSFLDFLRNNHYITDDIYNIILLEKEQHRDFDIFEFLKNSCDFSEEYILHLKCLYFEMDCIDVDYTEKIDNFDYNLIKDELVIPYKFNDNTVDVLVYDPSDINSMENLRSALYACDKTRDLDIRFHTSTKQNLQNMKNQISQNNDKSNIIEFVINDAISRRASDIHIVPFENIFEIKYRIDGDLELSKTCHISDFQSLCISIKVLANLDISESRRPQSGHFKRDDIDFRVSTHPTIYGESIVLRILNKNKSFLSIDKIGFSNDDVEYLKVISNYTNGMIIFCGPTGSGKTTSIYSILSILDKKSKNIVTLEDPVEYNIPFIRQTEIREGVIDFADGIRSILRQDPDIIFIGEIRDQETAKMSIRASMTGHLVLTTIHANDSLSALKRFQEFGIKSSIISDNIIAIISQRLVKKIDGGRTIISEILKVDQNINDMIYHNASTKEILEYAKKYQGFKTMFEDMNEKIQLNIIRNTDIFRIIKN